MQINAKFEGDIKEITRGIEKEVSTALRGGISRVADNAKQELRRQVIGAGLGPRVAKAWQSKVYPRAGVVTLNPAGIVYSKAEKIALAFAQGSIIKASKGRFLAIPTPAVANMRTRFSVGRNTFGERYVSDLGWSAGGGKGHRITPIAFEKETGMKLQLIQTEEGKFVLIARRKSRREHRRLFKGAPTSGPGAYSFVAFVLVKTVRLPKKLDPEIAWGQAARDIVSEIESILYS